MHNHRNPYPTHRRPPLALLLACVLIGLLLLAGILGWLAWQFQQFSPIAQAVFRYALFAVPLAGAVEAGVIVWRRWADRRFIEAFHVTQAIRARTQPAPNATSFSYHNSPRIEGVEPAEPEPLALPEPEPPRVPTVSSLLDSGRIGTGMRAMLLGFDAITGEAIEGSWSDLYSAGMGGLQGSGKTRAAAFLLAQSALMGGRLVICDPNPGNKDSLSTLVAPLAPAFLSDMGMVSTDRDILTALKHAKDKLEQRKRGGRAPFNICICIDEWLALRRGALAAELPALVESFSTEGRKYDVNAMLLAQRWDKEIAGDFRNTLASAYLFRMRRQEAAMLTGMGADMLPGDTLSLDKGECYLLDTHGTARRVRIPHLTPQDMVRVGGMLDEIYRPPIGFAAPKPVGIVPTAHAAPEATQNAPRTHLEATMKVPSTATARAGSLPPEAVRAAGLFLSGKPLAEITEELRGLDSKKGGAPYRRALAEVTELVRQAVEMKGGN